MKNLAKKYLEKGWSVIPVARNKIPLINWKLYQDKLATTEEIEDWWKTWPDANIGVVTGKISGIVVIDIDVKSGGLETLKTLKLPTTLVSQTGSGGFHYFFKYAKIKNSAGILQGVDIRGDGGYVVVPESIHLSGNPYKWLVEEELAEFPLEIFPIEESGEQNSNTPEKWKDIFENGAASGSRNNTAAKVAGFLLKRIERKNWKTAWAIYEMWCLHKLQPRISEAEYKATFLSIANAEIARLNKDGWLDKAQKDPNAVGDFIKSYTQVIPS